MPISILIVDDHALLRQGIRNVLELEPDFTIVGEADNGEDAVLEALRLEPDIVLLDINMPKVSGLEVTRVLTARHIRSRIIILSIHDDDNYLVEVVRAGASGYLLKDIEPRMLVQAIHSVHAGKRYIYPTLAQKLISDVSGKSVSENAKHAGERRNTERLTYREVEILQLVCQGMSNQAIAKQLFLSEKTVKNHLTSVFRKIHVNDRTQAVLYALKHKLVAID